MVSSCPAFKRNRLRCSIVTGLSARPRSGWTLARQLDFVDALADHGNVARAAASVGMSASSAYLARGRLESDIFGFGWKSAMAMAYYKLRDIALDRIEIGVATPSTHHGEVVATKTVFSDRLHFAVLTHLKPEQGTVGPTGLRPRPKTRAASSPRRSKPIWRESRAASTRKRPTST